jgi:hypothetical protein
MDFVRRYSYDGSCPSPSNEPLSPKEQDKEGAISKSELEVG